MNMALPDRTPDRSNLPVFVLTIDAEGGERRRSAERELARVGLAGQFMTGFHRDDPATFGEYSVRLNLLASKRSLTKGEIAVYCGHRAIWRKLLKSGAQSALVLEDDFKILDDDALRQALDDCLTHSTEWGMAKFFDFHPKPVKRRKMLGRTEIVRHEFVASGAVAYLINRETAQRFLSRARFFRPLDEDFSWRWELDLDIWSVLPNPVADGSEFVGGSLLEDGRAARKKSRNLARSIWGVFLEGYKRLRSVRDL
jgi:GR25 family glycosyltransferase involved in LPS biosynthesis